MVATATWTRNQISVPVGVVVAVYSSSACPSTIRITTSATKDVQYKIKDRHNDLQEELSVYGGNAITATYHREGSHYGHE